MKIAPIDIRQQRFTVKFRGFDPQEVDTFLEMVADALEELLRENARLQEELQRRTGELEEIRATESELKKALLAAHGLKEDISASAKKEAEFIIRDARAKANEILGSSKDLVVDVEEKVASLLRRKKQVVLNLRSMLETHLRMLEMEENDTGPPEEAYQKETKGLDKLAERTSVAPHPNPKRRQTTRNTDPSLPVNPPGDYRDV